jgi:myo-inositol 2-dehydrogenase / D-chiro-inositol 1-dehydrogenase
VVRVGVLGVGRMGAFHARVLARHTEVEKLSLCDVQLDRALALADEIGATVASSADALLDAVDAAVIATATDSHADLVLRAVRRGVPVLCEKPLAPDLATTDQLIKAVAREGGQVQVGFMRRFDPGFAAARQLVDDGKLGRLYTVRAVTNDWQPPAEEFVRTSGGMHADMQIHDFDLVRYVTGEEIVEVYADGSVLVNDYFARHGDVDVASVLLRLSSGALGVCTASRHDPRGYDVRLEVLGSLDSVAIGHDDHLPLRRIESDAEPATPYRSFTERFATAYRNELDAFLAYATGRRENPCPPEESRAALVAAIASDRSRAEHRPVRVEEVA